MTVTIKDSYVKVINKLLYRNTKKKLNFIIFNLSEFYI